MRTAEEILQSFDDSPYIYFPTVIEIINQARKEAIEECAKVADIKIGGDEDDPSWVVDTQSILKLIDELK